MGATNSVAEFAKDADAESDDFFVTIGEEAEFIAVSSDTFVSPDAVETLWSQASSDIDRAKLFAGAVLIFDD